MMTNDAANAFAHEWVSAWNAHDLERILSHWADDCVFVSARVTQIMGDPSGTVRGKAALRAYWKRGLEVLPDLHFELHTIFVGFDSVVLGYRNQRGQECAEMVRLGPNGLAIEGAAHYVGG